MTLADVVEVRRGSHATVVTELEQLLSKYAVKDVSW